MSPIFQIINYSEDAGYVTITRKCVTTSGTVIKTEYDTVVIGSSYTIPTNGPTISGYSYSSKDKSGTITANQNITITYTYKTYYTVTIKCVSNGSTIQSSSSSVLEGNSYTVPSAPTISNYNYLSCNYTIGSNITVNSNVTITYTYEMTIKWIWNNGAVDGITWSKNAISHGSYIPSGSISTSGSTVSASCGWNSSASRYCSVCSNSIDMTGYKYLHFNINLHNGYSAYNQATRYGASNWGGNTGSATNSLPTYTSTGHYYVDVSSLSSAQVFLSVATGTTGSGTAKVGANKIWLSNSTSAI